VGGLSWQTTPDKLKEYFGQFGSVTDVLIMKDPITQVSCMIFKPYLEIFFLNFVLISLKSFMTAHLYLFNFK